MTVMAAIPYAADEGSPNTDGLGNQDNNRMVRDPSWPQPQIDEGLENLDSAIGYTRDDSDHCGADLSVTLPLHPH